ncbi:TPA: hypothetical protein ACSTLW_005401 [Serratia fonticola]
MNQKVNNKKFSVEHALDMYASSFVTLPAEAIYDKENLLQYKKVIDSCHIYIIGYLPRIDFKGAEQTGKDLKLSFTICNQDKNLTISSIPPHLSYNEEDGYHYLADKIGTRFWWSDIEMMKMIHDKTSRIGFEVKYIGQAYGRDGSRSAMDRLIKHETLQKIAIKGTPEGYKLSLLLLEVEPNTSLVTAFIPNAQSKDTDKARIKNGLDKLYGTSESERISLYEAALIRYFLPEYNKEFKNSFPSTNLKILQDCYEKDFSAVFAQICIDELPFELYSDTVKQKQYHISTHDLHQDDDRKVFFCI